MKKLLYPILLIIIASSCVPQKRLNYVQSSIKSPELYDLKVPGERKIAPGNYLTINVNSPDERNFFQSGEGNSSMGTDEITLSRSAFLVDSLGSVNLPVIGKAEVSGLSLEECSSKLQKIIESYMRNPTVDVRFAYKSYTILGEVNNPGRFYYAKNGLSIFEAIGGAGDLTYYGKRKNVFIIRSENNVAKKIKVDLTDDKLLLSENYFIQNDDIILVKSRNYIRWEELSTPVSAVVGAISLFILIRSL